MPCIFVEIIPSFANGVNWLRHFLKRTAMKIRQADPSGMQDACHYNFVIDPAHRRVFVAQW